jgi:hypothetical protein
MRDSDWIADSFFLRLKREWLHCELMETNNEAIFATMLQQYKEQVFTEFEQVKRVEYFEQLDLFIILSL